MVLGPPGAFPGSPGDPLGTSETVLGALGWLLGRTQWSWVALGDSWAVLSGSWVIFDRFSRLPWETQKLRLDPPVRLTGGFWGLGGDYRGGYQASEGLKSDSLVT